MSIHHVLQSIIDVSFPKLYSIIMWNLGHQFSCICLHHRFQKYSNYWNRFYCHHKIFCKPHKSVFHFSTSLLFISFVFDLFSNTLFFEDGLHFSFSFIFHLILLFLFHFYFIFRHYRCKPPSSDVYTSATKLLKGFSRMSLTQISFALLLSGWLVWILTIVSYASASAVCDCY